MIWDLQYNMNLDKIYPRWEGSHGRDRSPPTRASISLFRVPPRPSVISSMRCYDGSHDLHHRRAVLNLQPTMVGAASTLELAGPGNGGLSSHATLGP